MKNLIVSLAVVALLGSSACYAEEHQILYLKNQFPGSVTFNLDYAQQATKPYVLPSKGDVLPVTATPMPVGVRINAEKAGKSVQAKCSNLTSNTLDIVAMESGTGIACVSRNK